MSGETGQSSCEPRGRLVEGRPVRFFFEGEAVEGLAGQTIGAALYARGVRTFSRSFKYHRPRGLFCVAGRCPNCLVEVDGTPNVRACMEPVREGAKVRTQNAWPSVDWDVLSALDRFDRLLPVGFYYKRMYRPRWMWPHYEAVIRRLAGLGRVDPGGTAAGHFETVHLHADVTVVGAGPAGISAAVEAARGGAEVVLLERMPRPGGHLLYEPFHSAGVPGQGKCTAEDVARQLAQQVSESERIRFFENATAFGVYEGNLVAAAQGERLLRIRTKHLLAATGADDRPLVFQGNDLPGVLLGRGALRLGHLYGVAPGERALVVTDGPGGYALAQELQGMGVDVVGVADLRETAEETAELAGSRLPVYSGHAIVAALGRRRVRGAALAKVDAQGSVVPGTQTRVGCDLICLSAGRIGQSELLHQARCGMAYDGRQGRYVPREYPRGLSAAGEVAGTEGLGAILLEGRLRGVEAALEAGVEEEGSRELCARLREELGRMQQTPPGPPLARGGAARAYPSLMPGLDRRDRKRFVCLCEDVTEKDLCRAVAEGFDNIETLKRYSTVCMGPCQGKVCSAASTEVCARETGRMVAEVGTTTGRPPAHPVALGVLARKFSGPARQTPLAGRHDALGARWMDAGAWKRPESYGDVEAEYRAVRSGVGLIDVSTLGKIELVGNDVVALLERVYLNRWAKLGVGRVRYGVMCTEDGTILDDGTCCRLGPRHFYMTTTTGNADYIFSWLRWWRDVWGLKVEVVDVTPVYAALSLVGPRAREVLGRVTDADLSTEAAPYMSVVEAEVAGVPARSLRIGFVGELGYELHVPAQYAEHVWDRLLEVSGEYGIRPVGVEAQRRLRLDKGHVIVGQDTDALSDPLAADMEWIVKFDKRRFVGRSSLLAKRNGARTERGERLVGFVIDGGAALRVPDEGSPVSLDGQPAGRVTSARYSDACGCVVGMAWVRGTDGQVNIDVGGESVAGRVVPLPFYDAQGERLKA